MSILFNSFLGVSMTTYVDYKRSVGRKFITEERVLRLLDEFFIVQGISQIDELQPVLIEEFMASRTRTRPRSYNHLLGVIRCFFTWLVQQETIKYSPVQTRPRRVTSQLRPFLFEPAQIVQLLNLAAQLPDNSRALHRAEVYVMIFSLMYHLGLRIGEVVRLRYQDINQERDFLIIDKSKFGKTRLVPFGPRVAQQISDYLGQCVNWYGPWQSDYPLFSFGNHFVRKNLRPETASQVFHRLLPKLELYVPPGVDTPYLHCLRHSFAVTTLLQWYRSGLDPKKRLFHLSTFMGHVDINSTAWYLTITDALVKEANHRFEQFALMSHQEKSL